MKYGTLLFKKNISACEDTNRERRVVRFKKDIHNGLWGHRPWHWI